MIVSKTSTLLALVTMAMGAASPEINNAVNATSDPELIKFLAPVVAGLLGKLMDLWFQWRMQKRKEKGVTNEL